MKTEATTPEGALGLWFDGVFLYCNETTRDLGATIIGQMTVGMEKKWEKQRSYYTFAERLKTQPHIFRSYVKGSSPSNGYAADPASYELAVDESGEDARGFFFTLQSSGAQSTRKIYLQQDEETGLWKILKFDSLYLGIKAAE